ncbi:hypothetical protein [Achromobacter anxifer]|uniref:hypothetical protein n=1 Tax=Achromobacter anxifer TaxID=1287737 RepID=UPI002157DDC1|nr:hypothetical protein [Achromobacter anxifer]
MRVDDPNLPYLRSIAEALGELRAQVVFVGGAVAGLLITDPLADPVRATRDVDAVLEANRGNFHRFEEALAARGFARDVGSDVICRWIHKVSGVLFDLMPVQPEVLGFSNRWYPYAVETAGPMDLGNGVTIKLMSAVAFVATKLEAFAGRGGGDFMNSHDLEDVLNIIDGREELAAELAVAPVELRQSVGAAFARLVKNPDFANVLPGLIAEPERADLIMERLNSFSQ